RVPNGDEHAIVAGPGAPGLSYRFGEHANRRAADNRRASVDGVTGLADDASSAYFHVLRPGIARKLAPRKPVADAERFDRGKLPQQLANGRRKPAVEADH